MAFATALAFGIDVGSSNTKVAAVAYDSYAATELRAIASPTPRDPAALLRLLAEAIEALIAEVGQPAVIGVASMAESGVALDGERRALTDIVRWDDGVAPESIEQALAGDEPRALHGSTGIAASAKVPLCMWAELDRRHPATWRRTRMWLGVSDLIVHALTGRLVTDHTLALRTMAVRRPQALPLRAVRWDPRLLARVGLTPAQLPEIVLPGRWARRAATDEGGVGGLSRGIPVVIAGHDHLVAAWAAGTRTPGSVANSIGTAEAVVRLFDGVAVPHRAFDEGMSLGLDVTATCSTIIAGSASAGRLLEWWGERAGEPVAVSASRIPTTDVLPTEPIVLPYLTGRQSPRPDAAARVSVAGEDISALGPARLRELAPSVLDGLALHAQWMRETQRSLVANERAARDGSARHPSAGEVLVIGGAYSSDDAWLRRKAAAFGVPVRASAVSEPVACGAAMLAAHRVRGDAGSAPTLALHPPTVPTPRSTTAYAEAYPRFVRTALIASERES